MGTRAFNYILLLISAMGGSILFSCKKEAHEQPAPQSEVTPVYTYRLDSAYHEQKSKTTTNKVTIIYQYDSLERLIRTVIIDPSRPKGLNEHTEITYQGNRIKYYREYAPQSTYYWGFNERVCITDDQGRIIEESISNFAPTETTRGTISYVYDSDGYLKQSITRLRNSSRDWDNYIVQKYDYTREANTIKVQRSTWKDTVYVTDYISIQEYELMEGIHGLPVRISANNFLNYGKNINGIITKETYEYVVYPTLSYTVYFMHEFNTDPESVLKTHSRNETRNNTLTTTEFFFSRHER